jgi:BMFP domain-containing protein YqiC
MLNLLQAADATPTAQAREAVAALQQTLAALEARWARLAKPVV